MNELRISQADYARLEKHLFRADHDEYGALLLAGVYRYADGGSLLTVREVHLLDDDDFPPGVHGYRQFGAAGLARIGNRASEENLALVTVHSHPGATTRNALSSDDLSAHERVFPHLLDITSADIVCGVALGNASAAGELWWADGSRGELNVLRIPGERIRIHRPQPSARASAESRFDRQIRLFGADGQARLRDATVAVVGAGGGGSILVEQLCHLGVGRILVIDHDVVKEHNLSRIMGATPGDVANATKKVDVAARAARQRDPRSQVIPVDGSIADLDVAERLVACDYIFLATDTATARLVANAVSQTFLIPTVQIGAKVDTRDDGSIEQIYTAVRPVLPRQGCLHCAGLIDAMALQREAASPQERSNQNYLGTADVIDPSVTTLNAAAAAGALNVFLMALTELAEPGLADHRITLTRDATTLATTVGCREDCRWCGTGSRSRYGRADLNLLPCRPATAVAPTAPPSRRGGLARVMNWFSRRAR